MPDQAAGLRQPARRAPPAQGPTLMVVGLPAGASGTQPVTERLTDWARHGRRWVGDPNAWRIVTLDPASPHLPLLASQQRRWALWVDSDTDAFRRAYHTLKILRRQAGPGRLLALHAPGLPRAGLLNNLQHGARRFLDIELVVLSS
ncbi:MAG TPA: hypothetical protein VFX91_11200 [Alcanivorax sp.]|nr:hypothetical protein [Alcanivorax sp.]